MAGVGRKAKGRAGHRVIGFPQFEFRPGNAEPKSES